MMWTWTGRFFFHLRGICSLTIGHLASQLHIAPSWDTTSFKKAADPWWKFKAVCWMCSKIKIGLRYLPSTICPQWGPGWGRGGHMKLGVTPVTHILQLTKVSNQRYIQQTTKMSGVQVLFCVRAWPSIDLVVNCFTLCNSFKHLQLSGDKDKWTCIVAWTCNQLHI